MKRILLAILFFSQMSHAQELGPPPPACDSFFAIDADDDGITQFDIPLYLDTYVRPRQEAFFGIDLSGYTLNMYASEADFFLGSAPITGIYTNQFNNQYCYLDYVYTGGGPEYPVGSSEWYNFSHCHSLNAIAASADYDGDGVLNTYEDLNANGFLNDDDTDLDGSFNFFDTDDDNDGTFTINEDYNLDGNWLNDDQNGNSVADYLDPEVTTLSRTSFERKGVAIYPNPADSVVRISGAGSAVIFDVAGKKVLDVADAAKPIDVSGLAPGLYIVKLFTGNDSWALKFMIE